MKTVNNVVINNVVLTGQDNLSSKKTTDVALVVLHISDVLCVLAMIISFISFGSPLHLTLTIATTTGLIVATTLAFLEKKYGPGVAMIFVSLLWVYITVFVFMHR